MTITESKRNFDNSGNVHYSKHKLFLYREDFEKFEDGFIDATDKIKELMATGEFRDPIAERKANDVAKSKEEEQSKEGEPSKEDVPEEAPSDDSTDSSDDEVKFEDL